MKTCIFAMLCCIAFLGGCASSKMEEIDLTYSHDQYPVLNESYQIGGIYKTMVPLYISGHPDSVLFNLEEEGGVNPFFSDYESNPDKYKKIEQYKNIKGIVCAGTSIEIKNLVYYPSQGSDPAGTSARGTILDGDFSGRYVDLYYISSFIYGTPVGILTIPNPKYISEESGEGASAGPVK